MLAPDQQELILIPTGHNHSASSYMQSLFATQKEEGLREIKIVRITLLADGELEPIYHSMVVFTILV